MRTLLLACLLVAACQHSSAEHEVCYAPWEPMPDGALVTICETKP